MTNKELKEALKQYDDDLQVKIVIQCKSIIKTCTKGIYSMGLTKDPENGKMVLALMAHHANRLPDGLLPPPLSPAAHAAVAEPPEGRKAIIVPPPIVNVTHSANTPHANYSGEQEDKEAECRKLTPRF